MEGATNAETWSVRSEKQKRRPERAAFGGESIMGDSGLLVDAEVAVALVAGVEQLGRAKGAEGVEMAR